MEAAAVLFSGGGPPFHHPPAPLPQPGLSQLSRRGGDGLLVSHDDDCVRHGTAMASSKLELDEKPPCVKSKV